MSFELIEAERAIFPKALMCRALGLSRSGHVAFYGRSPAAMGEREIREFLLHLVNEKKAGPATVHMYVAAIKFLYSTTLEQPEVVAKIPWPKRPQTLPDILTGEEVEQLFCAIRSLKHREVPGSVGRVVRYSSGVGRLPLWWVPNRASSACCSLAVMSGVLYQK